MRSFLFNKLSLLRDKPWMPDMMVECIDFIRYEILEGM